VPYAASMKSIWFVLLVSLGGFVLCVGLYRLLFSNLSKSWQVFPASTDSIPGIQQSHYASSSAGLLVDISGGVVQPGVYHLPPLSRLRDAILRAGGFSLDVDANFVIQRLNLVEKLHDSEKIYIPRRGENIHLPFLYSFGNDVNGVVTAKPKTKKKSTAKKKNSPKPTPQTSF